MSVENVIKVTSSVIISQEERYLFVQSTKNGTKWGFPGGKLNSLPYESFINAARRECYEELGVPVKLEPDPIGVYQYLNCRAHPVVAVAYAGQINLNPHIIRPAEIMAIKFFSLDDIVRMAQKNELRAGKASIKMLDDYRQGKRTSKDCFNFVV